MQVFRERFFSQSVCHRLVMQCIDLCVIFSEADKLLFVRPLVANSRAPD